MIVPGTVGQLLIYKGEATLDGKPVELGKPLGFGGGCLEIVRKIEEDGHLVNLRGPGLDGLIYSTHVGFDGRYRVTGENVCRVSDHPERFFRLLELLNITRDRLIFSEMVPFGHSGEDGWDSVLWPESCRDRSSELMRVFIRKRSDWRPMVQRIEICYSCPVEEFAKCLTKLLIGMELGADFFRALDGDIEAAEEYISTRCLLSAGQPYGSDSAKAYTAIGISPRPEAGLGITGRTWSSGEEPDYLLGQNNQGPGLPSMLSCFAKRYGVSALLSRFVDRADLLAEGCMRTPIRTSQLELARALEDVSSAAKFLSTYWVLFRVQQQGIDEKLFVVRPGHRSVVGDVVGDIASDDRVSLQAKLFGHPVDLMAEYRDSNVDGLPHEIFRLLLKKHGEELVDLLYASIPHTRHLRMLGKYPAYSGLSTQGDFLIAETGEPGGRLMPIGPGNEFHHMELSEVSEVAQCLSDPNIASIDSDEYIVCFLRLGESAFPMHGRGSQDGLLWIPDDGKRRLYVPLLRGCLGTDITPSVWAFCARRTEGKVRYETPDLEDCLIVSRENMGNKLADFFVFYLEPEESRVAQ